MQYHRENPVAVFLGPSLPLSEATRILEANYYPPVRMGDIYRLIGSGVSTIVILDGVFHRDPPVWQREILEALANGIKIVGAASMGALRAAELFPYGMIGHGVIFDWYRDGVIDGDDEVALKHGDASTGYRALSDPLVNLRATLDCAVQEATICQTEARELIAFAKARCYTDRSLRMLLNCPVTQGWSPLRREAVTNSLLQNSVNLKATDARSALSFVASGRHLAPIQSLEIPKPGLEAYRIHSLLYRGFMVESGALVTGKSILTATFADQSRTRHLWNTLVADFFVGRWAREREISCPKYYVREFRARWEREYLQENELAYWLTANGLTPHELDRLLERKALLNWIRENGPENFGLPFSEYQNYIEAIQEDPTHTTLRAKAIAAFIIADWARSNGIACPPSELQRSEDLEAPISRLHEDSSREPIYRKILELRALHRWIIEHGPHFFGFTTWNFEAEVVRELQYTGEASRIAASLQEVTLA